MRLLAVAVVAACAFPAAAGAHLPFRDGKLKAAEMERYFARSGQMREVRCAYRAPHLRCTAVVATQGLRVPMTVTVHRTSATRGYARVCAARSVCQNQPLRFSRR